MEEPRFKSKYPFEKVTRYIPRRYTNLQDWQRSNQNTVERFKKGKLNQEELESLVHIIKFVVSKYKFDKDAWIITFVPASTEEKYIKRYEKVKDYLREHLDIKIAYFGICIREEGVSKHEGGDRVVTPENIYLKKHLLSPRDKNIIVIDDVITTGTTLKIIGDFLMKKGANKVWGVMYAMTIHPNLPEVKRNYSYKASSIYNNVRVRKKY